MNIDTVIYKNNYVKGIFLMDYMLHKQEPVNVSELSFVIKKYYENNLGQNITENSARRILKRDILDKFLYKYEFIASIKKGRERYQYITPAGLYFLNETRVIPFEFFLMKYIEKILPPLKGLSHLYSIFYEISDSEIIDWEKERIKRLDELVNKKYIIPFLSIYLEHTGKKDISKYEKYLADKIENTYHVSRIDNPLKLLMDIIYDVFSELTVELFDLADTKYIQEYLNVLKNYRKKIEELVEKKVISVLLEKMLSCILLINVTDNIQRNLVILVLSGFSYDDVVEKINEYLENEEKVCTEFYNKLANELAKLVNIS